MRLIIKLLHEKKDLELTDETESCSIQHLKMKIEELRGIPSKHQRILFKGKPLSDTLTLKDYGIQNGDKLHLSVKRSKETDCSMLASKSSIGNKQKDFWISFEEFLERHFTVQDAKKVLQIFTESYRNLIETLSLDDLERIAKHELLKFK